MATKIFVEQENGDLANILFKEQLKRSSSAKPLQKGLSSKVFGSSAVMEKTARKALGNINKQTINLKPVPATKVKKPATAKVSETCIKPEQCYPEIEKIFPYDPEDFETFEVPEEHKLSHLCLAGVPLIVTENKAEAYRLHQELAPMDIPVFSWETDCDSPLLTTLDQISIDLPPMIY